MIPDSSARGAGRPRNFDTDRVLDAALELFWHEGYAATTTRTLAAELGLTQSSLYNAFGSKQKLMLLALERYQARITATLLGPLETSHDGLASITEFFTSLGQWVVGDGRRGCMLINLMAEDGGATDAISAQTTRYRERMRRAFARALVRAGEAGETSADHAEERADLLLGLVLGLNIAARGGASMTELRRFTAGFQIQIDGWRSSASV